MDRAHILMIYYSPLSPASSIDSPTTISSFCFVLAHPFVIRPARHTCSIPGSVTSSQLRYFSCVWRLPYISVYLYHFVFAIPISLCDFYGAPKTIY